jgi:hypothetical protein
MVRTQISLSEEERQLLARISAQTGRSMSALIRAAVAATYGSGRSADEDLAAMRRGRGAWKDREFNGESYVEALRPGHRIQRTA